MGRISRRKLRTIVLKILYPLDLLNEWHNYRKVIDDVLQMERIDTLLPEDKDFIEKRVKVIVNNRFEIDELLQKYLINWELKRLNVIERNILRLGVCELRFLGNENLPMNIVINEAVELAKRFGPEKAAGFVNGILDKIARDLKQEQEEKDEVSNS